MEEKTKAKESHKKRLETRVKYKILNSHQWLKAAKMKYPQLKSLLITQIE